MSALSGLVGIGECMVELSDSGDGRLSQSFAGDVFNTLWYARRSFGGAGVVRFLSAVGTDPLSDRMVGFAEEAGIDTRLIRRIPDRRPGLYMIHLDGAERSFTYWRDSSAARLLASDRSYLADALDPASVVYFSGITLAILCVDDAEGFLDCIAQARRDGKTVAFDPNIRPALWNNADRMRDIIERAASLSTIILPSFDDEAQAFGDITPEATLSRYASLGAELVVLKNGTGDVLVRGMGGTSGIYPTQAVDAPVDTTGAGDSFNGAFLAEYMKTGDVPASIRAGQSCAADVVCHYGALIGNAVR